MTGWVVVSFLTLYFALSLALSRLRAQLGAPTHSIELAMPNFMLVNLVGTRMLGPRSLGMFALLKPYLLEQRNNPTPLELEALKMAEGGRMQRRRIALALAFAAPLAILSYFWASIHVGYHLGLGTGNTAQVMLAVPRWLSEELAEYLRYPGDPSLPKTTAMGFGLVFTTLLMLLKLRFHWWPLHPVAYPIALSATVQSMTLVIFVTWLIKALLLRYGGLRAHRAALPLFLGMIAGQATSLTLQRLLFMLIGVKL